MLVDGLTFSFSLFFLFSFFFSLHNPKFTYASNFRRSEASGESVAVRFSVSNSRLLYVFGLVFFLYFFLFLVTEQSKIQLCLRISCFWSSDWVTWVSFQCFDCFKFMAWFGFVILLLSFLMFFSLQFFRLWFSLISSFFSILFGESKPHTQMHNLPFVHNLLPFTTQSCEGREWDTIARWWWWWWWTRCWIIPFTILQTTIDTNLNTLRVSNTQTQSVRKKPGMTDQVKRTITG